MNAISHSQQLDNLGREMRETSKQYHDMLIDDCAVQVHIRYAIIRSLAISWVKRCDDCPVGAKKSFHKRGPLAVDFDLYIDGVYQTSTTAHRPHGVFWESMGGTWGGRFRHPDGNHYSLGE